MKRLLFLSFTFLILLTFSAYSQDFRSLAVFDWTVNGDSIEIEITVPVIDGIPTITGTAEVGNTLTAHAADVSGGQIVTTWQWERDGVEISGATGNTYLLTTDDYGVDITVVQTATNSEGSDTAESNATTVAALTAPVITGVPTISGTPQVGSTLTVSPASVTGDLVTTTYQWERDGSEISGATNTTYELVADDAGTDITVVQTSTNAAGSDEAESDPLTIELQYVAIPTADVSGTSATLTYSNPGTIANSTGGDTQNKILSGAWTQAHANTLTGSLSTYRKISNADGDVVLGSVAGSATFDISTSSSDYFELNGKSASAPLYFVANGNTPLAAVQLNAWSAGPNARITNIVNTGGGYAVFANSAGTLSGGDATTPPTSSANYGKLELSFIRSFGPVDNTNFREHFYLGRTETNNGAIHSDLTVSNCFGYNVDGDAIQIAWSPSTHIYNCTFVTAGQDGVANESSFDAQDSFFQFMNSAGSIENNIAMDAPQAFRISAWDLIIRNNYVQWTGDDIDDAIQILDLDGNYSVGNRIVTAPKRIIIENNDFVATNWTGALIQMLDNNVDVIVRNNRIEGPTSLFDDDRSGTVVGQLIDGGGNTFVESGTIPTPVVSNVTATSFSTHGLNSEPTHHALGRGYRAILPDLEIASAETLDAITGVINGTDFATLEADYLPQIGVVTCDNGLEVTVEIDWQEGDYDGDVADTYTLSGTPTNLPSYVSNTSNISFSVDVTVQEGDIERTVLISLKGTGSSAYVGTGNWNHVGQDFATGAQTITGDNSSSTLASLRDTDGNLTGYGVSIVTQFQGTNIDGVTGGTYPDNAQVSRWLNPGASGSRTFTITGLNNSITYTVKIYSSMSNAIGGSAVVDLTVSGSSGGGTETGWNVKGNVSDVKTFTVVPSSGVITIAVTKNSGQAPINIVELNWTE